MAATWPFADAAEAAAVRALGLGGGASLEARAGALTEQLQALEQAKAWKRALLAEVAKPEHALGDLQRGGGSEHPLLYCLADKLGIVASIKRAVIDLHCSAKHAPEPSASPSRASASTPSGRSRAALLLSAPLPGASERVDALDSIQAARERWEAVTRDEMLKLAAELGKPLVAPVQGEGSASERPTAEQQDESAAVSDAEGAQQPGRRAKLGASRFLYDSRDLLHALQAIQSSNRAAASEANWGSIQLRLSSPPQAFAELAPAVGQVGLDERFPAERPQFAGDKSRVGELVLTHHSLTMARQFAKTGCPAHLRAQAGGALPLDPLTPHASQSLAVSVSAKDRAHFEALRAQADRWRYLTDDMYLLDLQRALDSPDFFVFEDHLTSAVLAFTRDARVQEIAPRVNGAVRDASAAASAAPSASVPPNGVLPFSGLVMYLAPLAYLATDPAELYFLFREMYARYWSRLNCISGDAGAVLHLCALFEDLVARSSPAAVFHLVNAGIAPLDVAFPWIQSAFAGVLDVQQVLLLWDRVVGFDSLEVVAYLAAALFHFRADELQRAETREAVDELFAEMLEIQVVPLLQSFLFLSATAAAAAGPS